MRLGNGESEIEFRRLAAIETDACVVWPYAKSGQRQYGLVYVSGTKCYAHRLALAARTPQPIDKPLVRHGPCNNPACMNYRHLSWGTPAENNLDQRRDGTSLGGERNPNARLKATEVVEIRAAYAAGGVSQHALAMLYGVTTMTINRAVRWQSWPAWCAA